jgi:hypothetical protein
MRELKVFFKKKKLHSHRLSWPKKIKKIHVDMTRGDSTQSSAMVCSQAGNTWNLNIARGNLREIIL